MSQRLLLAACIACLSIAGFSCTSNKTGEDYQPSKIGEVDELTRLSMRLNSKFKRSFEYNDFSLNYEARYPNTIVLVFRYNRAKTDLNRLSRVIAAAESNTRRVAEEDFKLEVRTQVSQISDVDPIAPH